MPWTGKHIHMRNVAGCKREIGVELGATDKQCIFKAKLGKFARALLMSLLP